MHILRSSKFSKRDSTIRERERERKHWHTESHSELIKQNRKHNVALRHSFKAICKLFEKITEDVGKFSVLQTTRIKSVIHLMFKSAEFRLMNKQLLFQ